MDKHEITRRLAEMGFAPSPVKKKSTRPTTVEGRKTGRAVGRPPKEKVKGPGRTNYAWSDESKLRAAVSHLGMSPSPETRAKISASLKGRKYTKKKPL